MDFSFSHQIVKSTVMRVSHQIAGPSLMWVSHFLIEWQLKFESLIHQIAEGPKLNYEPFSMVESLENPDGIKMPF